MDLCDARYGNANITDDTGLLNLLRPLSYISQRWAKAAKFDLPLGPQFHNTAGGLISVMSPKLGLQSTRACAGERTWERAHKLQIIDRKH